MRRPTRSLSAAWVCLGLGLAIGVGSPVGLNVARAEPRGDCRQTALGLLRAASPDGYAIYRQISDPTFFQGWIDCDDAQFDLSTAVHESTHFITSETDAFPLVGGGAIERPHDVSEFFPPAKIAGRFQSDDFTTIYLRQGKASSSTDVLFLLDEFNAYSHDLATAVALRDRRAAGQAVDHRDGLAAMMAFLAVYAAVAKESEPKTWRGLQTPRVAGTIAALWSRAERVIESSCGIADFGTRDRYYLGVSCAGEATAALEPILGRAPVCPTTCLTPAPDLGQTGDEAEVAPSSLRFTPRDGAAGDGAPGLGRPHHPFNLPVGPRRHRLGADEDE